MGDSGGPGRGSLPEIGGDALAAAAFAAVLSGLPSTLHSLRTARDPLEATEAAGSLVLSPESPRPLLIAAALPVHAALSVWWAVVLSAVLPRRHTIAYGALSGLGIGVLDLLVVGRRFPRVRRLALGPQLADHACFGAVVGMVVARRRARRLGHSRQPGERVRSEGRAGGASVAQ